MNERYVATLYQKIELSDNTFIFKRVGVLPDSYINLENGIEELTYFDGEKRLTLNSIECPYAIISDDEYCYGYPILMNHLQMDYPDITDEMELICKYMDEMSEVVNIAYYDEENDRVKLLTTNIEVLKNYEDIDTLFNIFCMEADSNEDKMISIPFNDIDKMIKCIDSKNYQFLKEKLIDLSKNIDEVDQIISKHILSNEENKSKEKDQEIDDIIEELMNLVGLDNIKNEIVKLSKYLKYKEKANKYLNLEQPNLHMFFTGNPGTGKTTVARIIGKLLYKMGYLKSNKVAEVTPKDLIAEYVGQTAPKTANFIKKNKGGVIFIDEAYVFAGKAQEFAEESLTEILKELEKNETVFIFAGYKDEMENFMKINPGFTSRIGYYLDYEDYTVEQLYEIFEIKTKQMGFIIEENLKLKVLDNLRKAKENKHFGNGRYIDKLINKIILEHGVNVENYKSRKKLITLTASDFNDDVAESLIYKSKIKKIGFGD